MHDTGKMTDFYITPFTYPSTISSPTLHSGALTFHIKKEVTMTSSAICSFSLFDKISCEIPSSVLNTLLLPDTFLQPSDTVLRHPAWKQEKNHHNHNYF